MAELWILSGVRGAGKTNLCSALAQRMRMAGWNVAGVISPGVFFEGHKVAIDVVNAANGERRTLAHSRLMGPNNGIWVRTRAWDFDTEALQWGDQILNQATPCDLLVIDELGALEFERGQGWLSGFSAVDSQEYRAAVVVIRPELVPAAKERWPEADVLSHERIGGLKVDDLVRRLLLLSGETDSDAGNSAQMGDGEPDWFWES